MPGVQRFVERFTPDEERILRHFFTNTGGSTFATKNLPQETSAALFARYSRSQMSVRRLFLAEFIRDPDTGKVDEGFDELLSAIDTVERNRVGGKRAKGFFARVIAQYGDDSVIDMGGTHVAVEGVDQIEAKLIEDSRLAGYIEKSTRYMDFTGKLRIDNEGFVVGPSGDSSGNYLYKEYPEVQASTLGSKYTYTMDRLFETVRALQGPVAKALNAALPLGEQVFTIEVGGEARKVKFDRIRSIQGIDADREERKARRAYETAIKAKTFDLTRGPLPASTITNIGMYASFRTYEYQIMKMLAASYPPINATAQAMHGELIGISEPLMARVSSKHGDDMVSFLKKRESRLHELARSADAAADEAEAPNQDVELLIAESTATDWMDVAAATLFPYSKLGFRRLRRAVDQGIANETMSAAVRGSLNRRYKPPRSFEIPTFIFQWTGNFGIFRDLQRNRFTLQVRQDLTTDLGYDMPEAIVDSGMESAFRDAMEASKTLHADMLDLLPAYAQSAVTFAHRLRWLATMDLRQAVWMLQLRTGIQGHPDYRKLMQQTYRVLNDGFPDLVNSETMPHVDLNPHELERLAAAHRTENKLERLSRHDSPAE
ncbi:MAG: FAD-dependent thymidylate synthase [Candidatus Marsarchaeota archaeon]|nr:FAD-dependent thymidylate synthase [Candidatus Marsarchaeota archaeon]MCL5111309.1 FAD-dependent thymidylate synthase [Candidatus Marsarchaeota archaeon]